MHLLKAIDSLTNQSLNKELYEIIVVDNASNDETRDEVLKKCNENSNLLYLSEPNIGLTAARNTGWKNARGKYVAYMDDDAIANDNWLKKIVDVFENVKPMPGTIGGKIEPIWETEKPGWLTHQLEPYLTILDWSDKPKYISENEYLAGANMAFPKFLLETFGGFQHGLGRTGSKLISNEEISLLNKIRKSGYSIYYHPDISVRHWIPTKRMSISWFLSRFFWQGYSDSVMWLYNEKPSFFMRMKLLCISSFQWLFDFGNLILLINHNTGKLQNRLDSYYKLGKIRGLLNKSS